MTKVIFGSSRIALEPGIAPGKAAPRLSRCGGLLGLHSIQLGFDSAPKGDWRASSHCDR